MLNVEKLKERLETYQKKCAEDKTTPWKRIDEIYGNPLIRALRHVIEARTSHHAEWEIRYVFNQIYKICKKKYKVMFVDAKEEEVDGLLEITFKNKKV